MAKKSSIEKNQRRQQLVDRKLEKRKELKKIIYDMSRSEDEREHARILLNKMPRDSSPIRVRNRCAFTGRSRGYLRKFKMSRLCFREMASAGLIPGVTKASW